MQSEMAKLKQVGKMEWKSHGKWAKTKILHGVIGKTPSQTQDIFQFTMEMNYNQVSQSLLQHVCVDYQSSQTLDCAANCVTI